MSNIKNLGNGYQMPGAWPESAQSLAPDDNTPDALRTAPAAPEILDPTTPKTVQSLTHGPDRRRAPRPDEAFSALLFSDSAFNGNIPCTSGAHQLEGMGLENVALGLGRLKLDVPRNTQVQVHSHAIDREPVAPLPPPSPLSAVLTGFVTFWALSAWSWITSAVKGEPDFHPLEKPPIPTRTPRDGKVRIHGMEAALTQPLTLTRPGIPPWVVEARITGASVDEHGRVTPRGALSLFGLFTISLARFRDKLPTLNVEIDKLRQGQLVANASPDGPGVNVGAICEAVSKLTGEGVFTVTRQPGARPLQYKFDVIEPLRNMLSNVEYDVTPVHSETNARVKLNPNASVDLEAHQRATTHLQLQLPHLDMRTYRVQSESRVVMPQDGANWWRAHTVYVVDQSPTHATDEGSWQPFVSGAVTVKQRDDKLRTDLRLRTAAGVAGQREKSASGTAVWKTREDGSAQFEKADGYLPLDEQWGRFNVDIERDDLRLKASRTLNGKGKRLRVQAESRVVDAVEVNRKKA